MSKKDSLWSKQVFFLSVKAFYQCYYIRLAYYADVEWLLGTRFYSSQEFCKFEYWWDACQIIEVSFFEFIERPLFYSLPMSMQKQCLIGVLFSDRQSTQLSCSVFALFHTNVIPEEFSNVELLSAKGAWRRLSMKVCNIQFMITYYKVGLLLAIECSRHTP